MDHATRRSLVSSDAQTSRSRTGNAGPRCSIDDPEHAAYADELAVLGSEGHGGCAYDADCDRDALGTTRCGFDGVPVMFEMGFWPDKGYVLCGDCKDIAMWLLDMHCCPSLVIADPPYGKILDEDWDTDLPDIDHWIKIVRSLEAFNSVVYWWGGIGKPNNRVFFEFLLKVEKETRYKVRDIITWKKVRAYGKSSDYLFTREECLVLTVEGKDYPLFNIPLLEEKRGYAGYNSKYPAKSEYKRRSNVWCETELLKNKLHPAHKAPIVCRIPIEVHTREKELVLDLYAGSGETSIQALESGRTFIAVERDKEIAAKIVSRIQAAITVQQPDADLTEYQ